MRRKPSLFARLDVLARRSLVEAGAIVVAHELHFIRLGHFQTVLRIQRLGATSDGLVRKPVAIRKFVEEGIRSREMVRNLIRRLLRHLLPVLARIATHSLPRIKYP